MADTERTHAEILALLANNDRRLISAQDVRDAYVTLRRGAGHDFFVPPSATPAARVNEAANAIALLYGIDGRMRNIHLEGDYALEAPFRLGNGSDLVMSRNTKLRWGAAPPNVSQADVPTNAMVIIQGTISGTNTGTLTATAQTDAVSLTTNITGTVPIAGDWLLLLSDKTHVGHTYQSWHGSSTILRGEPVRVKTVTPLGGSAYGLTLYSPIRQIHGSGSFLRAMTPVLDVGVRGGDFKLEGMAGNPLACGIFAEGVLGMRLDVHGAGLSRALVNLHYCRDVTGGIRNRGENNSSLICDSSHDVKIFHDYDTWSTLAKAHTNGIPRGVQYVASSMNCPPLGRIGHQVGLEIKGLCESVFDLSIEDCDFTERGARDPNLFLDPPSNPTLGGVMMNCSNPGSVETEIPYGLSGSVRMRNCRVTDPSGTNLHWAALFVDPIKTDFDSFEIINDGLSPGTTGAKAFGLAVYDSSTFDCMRIRRFATTGIEAALGLLGGGNNLEIDRWEYNPYAGVAAAGTVMILFGHNGAGTRCLKVRHLVCIDTPNHFIADHDGSATPAPGIDHDSMRGMVFDLVDIVNTGVRASEVRPVLDVSGLADFGGNMGDGVEVCPPRACTLNGATGVFTSAAHDIRDKVAGYIGGTALPAGYTAGTLVYVRDSNLGAGTFKVASVMAGTALTFGDNGTGLTFTPSVRTVRTPTHGATYDKGTLLNGVGSGAGLALPLRMYLAAFGEYKVIRMGAVQVLPNELVKLAAAARTGTVDNASTDPLGYAFGKPTALAGIVQVYRR